LALEKKKEEEIASLDKKIESVIISF